MFNQVVTSFPNIDFKSSSIFAWRPSLLAIEYDEEKIGTSRGLLLLLHEIGHHLSGHDKTGSDRELLKQEVQAWAEAKLLAAKFGLPFDEEVREECLETYRDWLYHRSLCPTCDHQGLEMERLYHCINCNEKWQTTTSLHCQIRRIKK